MDEATEIRPQDASAPAVPGYQLEHLIGEGGMGRVYAARDLHLGRRVAIKLIASSVAQNADTLARFQREARTLATIDHPNIVRVYSFGGVDNVPYLVMEHVDGETLAARISRGPLSVDEALRITRAIAEAIDAAWEHQIVHRDIKPSNVLLDSRGNVRVTDFGLAKPLSDESVEDVTASGLVVGTAHYLSPEQAEGRGLDVRSDIYSLGIVLFEMLTGERPFKASTPVGIIARHLREPLPPLPTTLARAHPDVEALLRDMTAKVPDNRPRTARELIERIDGLRVPSSRRWWTISLIAAATLIVISVLITASSRRPVAAPEVATKAAPQRTYSGQPISMTLENADIRDVVATFAKMTEANMVVDNDVRGSVSVNFENVPWDRAMEAFLQQNGLTSVVEGNVIRIARLDTLLAEKEKEKRLRELQDTP